MDFIIKVKLTGTGMENNFLVIYISGFRNSEINLDIWEFPKYSTWNLCYLKMLFLELSSK